MTAIKTDYNKNELLDQELTNAELLEVSGGLSDAEYEIHMLTWGRNNPVPDDLAAYYDGLTPIVCYVDPDISGCEGVLPR